MTRYWVGVACRAHVRIGQEGGFCQLSHGRRAPVLRLQPGDGLVYYAPGERLGGGARVQAFVAIGQVTGPLHQAVQSADFYPWRRAVRYWPGRDAPIRPLRDRLSFVPEGRGWGMVFRRGVLEIPAVDFARIAQAMGCADAMSAL